jgi:CelD/BcsL family acetyltransferase involved in cellulose biosynthesis
MRTQPGFLRALGGQSLEDGLSRNTRQQLRRNMRECEKLGPLCIEAAASSEAALTWFAELKALHVRSWTRRGRRHAFHYPFFERFHRALIETNVSGGSVRLWRVSAGSSVLGYLYEFLHDACVYSYQSGFDDSHADLRPGYISHALAMEQSGWHGVHAYDFLGGENRLKHSFGNQRYVLGWHHFGRPTTSLRLEAAALRMISRVRRRPDRNPNRAVALSELSR